MMAREKKENARLIDAAPDMAKALLALVALAYNCEISDDDEMIHEKQVEIALSKAHSALAKAGVI